MLDWKIIAAALVTLTALLVSLAGHPAVRDFFGSISIPAIGEEFEEGNLSFSLVSGRQDFSAQARRQANITLSAEAVSGSAKEVSFESAKGEIRLVGYTGRIVVNSSMIELNGTMERFELGSIFVVRGPVYLSGSFGSARISGLAVEKLELEDAKVKFDGAELVSGVTIHFLVGNFSFGDGIAISGTAKRISSGRMVIA